MKNFITAIIISLATTLAFAGGPAGKMEEVKKPATATAPLPATPKEMPKVKKPKTKAEKEAEAKACKSDPTKCPAPEDKKDAKKTAK